MAPPIEIQPEPPLPDSDSARLSPPARNAHEESQIWLTRPRANDPIRDAAVLELHGLLLRAARFEAHLNSGRIGRDWSPRVLFRPYRPPPRTGRRIRPLGNGSRPPGDSSR